MEPLVRWSTRSSESSRRGGRRCNTGPSAAVVMGGCGCCCCKYPGRFVVSHLRLRAGVPLCMHNPTQNRGANRGFAARRATAAGGEEHLRSTSLVKPLYDRVRGSPGGDSRPRAVRRHRPETAQTMTVKELDQPAPGHLPSSLREKFTERRFRSRFSLP